MTLTGAGTETLTGTNGYTGLTTITSGKLALTGTGSIAASIGVVDNGAFDISGTTAGASITTLSGSGAVALGAQTLTLTNQSSTFSGGINGAGGLTLTGAGTETLTGTNGYTGLTTITSGTLALTGTGSIAASSGVVDNGTFNIAGTTAGASITTLSGSGAVALGAQTLTLTNQSSTFSGGINGAGGLTLTGAGTETLTGTNTYTGDTTISAGTLQIGGSGSLGTTAPGVGTYAGAIADNGTFEYSSSAMQTLSGVISGAGAVTVDGTGTLALTQTNAYTGATTIASGTLALTGTGSIAASSGIVDNGAFDISGTAAGASITTLSGSGAVALGAQTLTLTSASGTFAGALGGTGGLTLANGTETLSGANTYTGNTTLAAATTLNVSGGIGSSGMRTGVIDVGTAANLNVNSGGSIYSGLVTNGGALMVNAGGLLNATGLTNLNSGTVTNSGTIVDDLNNAGVVTNDGMYTALVASNTGTITNNATWDGTAGTSANGTGLIINSGLWKGSWSNAGGTINNAGEITGNVTNISGIVNNINTVGAHSTIDGNVTANGGVVYSYNPTSTIGGSVFLPGAQTADVFALGAIKGNVSVNSGGALGAFYVGDQTASTVTNSPFVAATLASHLGQTLTVNGSVSGPITIPVDLSTGRSNAINAGSNNGGTANLSGMVANPGNLLWANRTLTYATGAGIPLSGTANLVLAGASNTFYQYTAENNNTILQSLKSGVVSAPAAQVSSIITALTTSFFQNAQAFLGAPTNPTPNLWYGGVWSRAGGAESRLDSTATGGGSNFSTETKSTNDIGGFQFGIDEGLYNINNSKMNVHLGLTAGEAFANSSDSFNTPGTFISSGGVSTHADVPFYGVYVALTGKGLAATAQWRRNLFDLKLNDPSLGTQSPQKLNAQGNTYSVDVGYQIPFGNGFSIQPSAAVFITNTNVDSLPVSTSGPSSIFQFDTLNSTLGRFGGRLATTYALNENLFLVPYLTANVWHEFQGGSTTNFTQAGAFSTVPAVYTNSVGTFGQVSLGFATQSPKAAITTYLQADLRFGSNIQGWGVIGGLRYSY